ncbi:PREDICTED: isopentenyl-diphosphate delta-isomerase 2-like [Elephantulus edwardii]|uniref:isopentenyl-diphosphate delta-isomerase 2-like n=1 Tax=Elephantulus edwardii TaxID=28737 RepID=UPI0003F06C8D|nr:PREDICTED: isopentenyl-diphosphate delta-isomerase 2-like [Elephantulus edwardii]
MPEVNIDWLDECQRHRLKEMLVVVDENDKVIGANNKRNCHLNENIDKGLLHRSFSVLLFNEENKVLIQQRADTKVTFPGYYSDSCCSHPLFTPLELEEQDAIGVKRAALRRMQAELGIPPGQVSIEDILFMTIYHHKAKSDANWGEHEICYLLLVKKNVPLNPDLSEAKSVSYMNKEELQELLDKGARGEVKVAPWLRTIAEKCLPKWWDHLGDIVQLAEPNTIYRV